MDINDSERIAAISFFISPLFRHASQYETIRDIGPIIRKHPDKYHERINLLLSVLFIQYIFTKVFLAQKIQ